MSSSVIVLGEWLRVRGQGSLGARLKALRRALAMSQVELAQRIARHQTAIGAYERDEYAPSAEIVLSLAQVLETTPEFLLFGRVPTPGAEVISLLGRIGPGGLLHVEDGRGPEAGIILRGDRVLGLVIEDDSMAPLLRPGQMALVAARSSIELSACLGRDVLAELVDGRSLLRRLQPSIDPARFDLGAHNAPTLRQMPVRAVRPVLGTLSRELVESAPYTGP